MPTGGWEEFFAGLSTFFFQVGPWAAGGVMLWWALIKLIDALGKKWSKPN